MKKMLLIFFVFAYVFAYASDSIHIELGMPLAIKTTDEYVIFRHQYVTNYNNTFGNPNWVAWNLNKDWYGDVERYKGDFFTDTSLPAGYYRVKHSDYDNSGFDRGHMVRSEERTATVEDNRSTFILTNIIPQTPELNRNTWLKLEYYCEDLCKDSLKELFVYAGPHYSDNPDFINNKIAIPDSCFKIIIILDCGQRIKDVNENTKVIAVMMPNDSDVKSHEWTEFQTTIRQIENSTGFDFLSNLSLELQEKLENPSNTDVSERNTSQKYLYPNPAEGVLMISGLSDNFCYVYNSIGIYIESFYVNSNNYYLNVENLPAGFYVIKNKFVNLYFIKI